MMIKVQTAGVREDDEADIEYYNPELGKNSLERCKVSDWVACHNAVKGINAEV